MRLRNFMIGRFQLKCNHVQKTLNHFRLPSNRSAEQSPMAPDLSTVKLINYDFITYGSSSERKRLLKKWDDEVSTLPQ